MGSGHSPKASAGNSLPMIWSDLTQRYRLLLGSQSPRRQELLRGLDLPFELVRLQDLDESYPADMRPEDIPAYLSQVKAKAYRPQLDEHSLLITADTLVFLEDEVLGKPADEVEAEAMLHRLCGRTHHVTTGVTLSTLERMETFSDTAEVSFLPLTSKEIHYYVSHYKPLDKAGAYGIQEWIGYRAIRQICGSFYTVMGLPVHLLSQYLIHFK